jgi:hypothetical protein
VTLKAIAVSTLLSLLPLVEGSARPHGGADPSRVYAAHSYSRRQTQNPSAGTPREPRRAAAALPAPARLREAEGRGLLVRVWVNGLGPYTFALDTGAGANILSRRVAAEARVRVDAGAPGVRVGGLSGAGTTAARRAYVSDFAIGARGNLLPSQGFTVVADGLPPDLDGVLDPTETFSPLGFTIDIPGETVSAFEPRATPLRTAVATRDEVVVRWLSESSGRRPFVMLAEGRRALIDTGSGFGLAVSGEAARALGIQVGGGRDGAGARDIAGGPVPSRRVRPATVHVGALALRNVPTDYLYSAGAGAPILLGRDALRPFEISFDPLNRLIRFRAS